MEYTKQMQVGPEKPKDNRSFRQKYGKPLDRSKYKFTAKKTPLKKSNKPIRQQGAKKAKQRKNVAAMVSKKVENVALFCKSCGSTDSPLDPSHLLQQGRSVEYADNALNVHWHCRTRCHDLCENQHYYLMNDGLEIMTKLFQMGDKGKQRLRSALQKWDGLNLDRFQLSPVYPQYLEEMKNF